jgi:EpsI family protein
MNSRRDFLMGAACLGGAGVSYALVPRRHLTLLPPDRRLEQIIPRSFGDWVSQDVTDLVAPKVEGSLVSRLYGETVGRVYSRSRSGSEVMMLLAYGNTQSDDLQLHRPEICYPAFGFAISKSTRTEIGLSGGISIPSRSLVADAPGRRETIVYWSRLGEFLPRDRKEQQVARLRTAIHGDIADGILARFSVVGPDPSVAITLMRDLIPALLHAVPTGQRAVLLGSQRAMALGAAGF